MTKSEDVSRRTDPQQIGRVFEIALPEDDGDAWHATSGHVAASLYPGKAPADGSKRLVDGRKWRVWKQNVIRRACTPAAATECWLMMELNGVFVHVQDGPEGVRVVMADRRLTP